MKTFLPDNWTRPKTAHGEEDFCVTEWRRGSARACRWVGRERTPFSQAGPERNRTGRVICGICVHDRGPSDADVSCMWMQMATFCVCVCGGLFRRTFCLDFRQRYTGTVGASAERVQCGRGNLRPCLAGPCLLLHKIQKLFKISRHIESLDICIEY